MFQIHFINANLSRCFGSIFAWILKTNPDIFGSTILVSDSFGRDGAISTKQSNSSRTPKLFNAEPKRLVVIFRPDNLGDQI
jgi:hypothetical protein